MGISFHPVKRWTKSETSVVMLVLSCFITAIELFWSYRVVLRFLLLEMVRLGLNVDVLY